MRFAVIDLEGSTLDAFESGAAAARVLKDMVRSDPALGEDLSVVEYREGVRVGSPRSVSEFLEHGGPNSSKVIVVEHPDVVERDRTAGIALLLRRHRWSDRGLVAGHC